MGRPSAMIEQRLLALLEKESIAQDAAWIADKLRASKKTVAERLRQLTRTGAVKTSAGWGLNGYASRTCYKFVEPDERVPCPDKERLRPAIVRIMSEKLDDEGFGQWMTVLEIAGKDMPHIPVQRRLVELWRDKEVEARLNPDGAGPYESNQYRILPRGDDAPLYVPPEGWNTKTLAECLGGLSYLTNRRDTPAAHPAA